MFECSCCHRTYQSKKTLNQHLRKTDPDFITPRKKALDDKRDQYNLKPSQCRQCQTTLSFEDSQAKKVFCNHTCSAIFNNHRKRRKYQKILCEYCLESFSPTNSTVKYCSVSCSATDRRRNNDRPRFERGEIHTRKTLKKALIEDRSHACELCDLSEWLGDPIPLEVDHINGDASNNKPGNLRLLCPNCHAKQPTSKGKNRGNGRRARGLPLH